MKEAPTRDEELELDRRELILSAAISVFAAKGYGSARIEDVAKEAGLSYGLAYYYFASKDKLFHTVVERAIDSSLSIYSGVVQSEGSFYSKLRILAETLLTTCYSKEGMPYTLIMVEAFTELGIPKVTRKLVEKRVLEYEASLVTMIRGAQSEGYAPGKDPRILATMFNALIEGLAVARIANPTAPLPDVDQFLFFLN